MISEIGPYRYLTVSFSAMWGTGGVDLWGTSYLLQHQHMNPSTKSPKRQQQQHPKNLLQTHTSTMSVQTKATIASFGGKLLKLTHNASTTNCEMGFNLYLPPQATLNPLRKVPVLIYLSGLTCTGDNCAEKGFFQHGASQKGIAVLYPDTSPRTLSSCLSLPTALPTTTILFPMLMDVVCCVTNRRSQNRWRRRLLRLRLRGRLLRRRYQRALEQGV